MMRTLDASRWAIFRRVEAPTALPSFFSGAKVAVAIAPIVALFAELAGSNSGLMLLIIQANNSFREALVFAAAVDPGRDRGAPGRPHRPRTAARRHLAVET